MKKVVNRLPLIFTVVIFIFTFCSSAFLYLNTSGELVAALGNNIVTGGEPLKDYSIIDMTDVVIEEGGTSSEAEQGGMVQVSASPSNAIGKIYEQFLSPYSAKLSYNGIYIKNSTGLSVDIKQELASSLELKIAKTSEPQVLIVHTHATESYMMEERDYYTAADASRSTDNSKNVIKVGEIIAETLKNGGIGVIHDKTQHDHPSYNGSYTRAAKTINEYLNKYPSIKVVIDVHRDSIAMTGNDKAKPTAEINGKKAAQVMLVVGSETGSVTGFPNWRQNFRLALRYQQTLEIMYPGLARQMLFASRKYNMNLTKGSMLLEVGTDSNTLEEACYSGELAGKALASLLNTLR